MSTRKTTETTEITKTAKTVDDVEAGADDDVGIVGARTPSSSRVSVRCAKAVICCALASSSDSSKASMKGIVLAGTRPRDPRICIICRSVRSARRSPPRARTRVSSAS